MIYRKADDPVICRASMTFMVAVAIAGCGGSDTDAGSSGSRVEKTSRSLSSTPSSPEARARGEEYNQRCYIYATLGNKTPAQREELIDICDSTASGVPEDILRAWAEICRRDAEISDVGTGEFDAEFCTSDVERLELELGVEIAGIGED